MIPASLVSKKRMSIRKNPYIVPIVLNRYCHSVVHRCRSSLVGGAAKARGGPKTRTELRKLQRIKSRHLKRVPKSRFGRSNLVVSVLRLEGCGGPRSPVDTKQGPTSSHLAEERNFLQQPQDTDHKG